MKIEKSSFRDNSGFIFYHQGEIFRAITFSYKDNYDHLIKSGLYNYLVEEKLLIPHSIEKLRSKDSGRKTSVERLRTLRDSPRLSEKKCRDINQMLKFTK